MQEEENGVVLLKYVQMETGIYAAVLKWSLLPVIHISTLY